MSACGFMFQCSDMDVCLLSSRVFEALIRYSPHFKLAGSEASIFLGYGSCSPAMMSMNSGSGLVRRGFVANSSATDELDRPYNTGNRAQTVYHQTCARIGFKFDARAHLVVVRRVDGGAVAQGQDAVVHRAVELLGGPTLEVCAAAAADQQRVAREYGAVVIEDEGQAPSRVPCGDSDSDRK